MDKSDRKLIAILSDGKFHSGEALGAALGVSRAAIWKRLQSLPVSSLIERRRNMGYRICAGVDLLSEDDIQRKYSGRVALFDVIDSTNQYLMTQSSTKTGDVCLAEVQTAGRGRRGRQWQSPFAENIYASMVWHFDDGLTALEGLSLAVGVAVTAMLAESGIVGATLKWPNDVLVDGKKIAGILVEMSGLVDGACKVVVGVGVNVHMRAQDEIDQPWVSMSQLLPDSGITRTGVANSLLLNLERVLNKFELGGFSVFVDEWLANAAYLGQSVNIVQGKNSVTGKFVGIAPNGSLRLELSSSQVLEFSGGEVSLRVA